MSLDIVIENSGDGSFGKFNWLVAATRWADMVGPICRSSIKAEAPVAKGPAGGRLRDSIRYERKVSSSNLTISFGSSVPYAMYVVTGTAPHLIRPKAARALHWMSNGSGTFAYLVHHPGTKANNFVKRGMDRVMPAVQAAFVEQVQGSMAGKW